jgi:hypothetical protein
MAGYFDAGNYCKQAKTRIHHSTISIFDFRCEHCGDLNPNWDSATQNNQSTEDIVYDTRPRSQPPDPNRDRFTSIPENATVLNLADSPHPIKPDPETTQPPPRAISLPGPQRPYIRQGIGEEGRQESIVKESSKKKSTNYKETEKYKLVVYPCRQFEVGDHRESIWRTLDVGMF